MPFDYSCLPNLPTNDSTSILTSLDQLVSASRQGYDFRLPAIENLKAAFRIANILYVIQNKTHWDPTHPGDPLLFLLLYFMPTSRNHPYRWGETRPVQWKQADFNSLHHAIEEFCAGLRRKLTASPSLNGTRQSEGEKATADNPPNRSKKVSRAEANVIVREWIEKNAPKAPRTKLKRDAIAQGTGISTGTVSNTSAWKAYSNRWDEEYGPTARNIPLTDQIRANIPVDDVGKAESEQKNAVLKKLIQDEELNKLIQEQEDDQAEENRRHKRRHGPS